MKRRCWAGVDVGGRRKGFHLAMVDEQLQVTLGQARTADECVAWLEPFRPRVVAIDSPCEWAPGDELSRPCEREFAGLGLCGIRYTPNEAAAQPLLDTYYDWIQQGLTLWTAVRAKRWTAVECFPTAAWTAWLGPRGSQRRAAWTRAGIARLREDGVHGLDAVRNQDQRDAVAAALTARQWDLVRPTMQACGDLVVPVRQSLPICR